VKFRVRPCISRKRENPTVGVKVPVLAARARGEKAADLAFRMFVHILRKYTGAYCFGLGDSDAFVFTGGIGEHSPGVRAALFEGLAPLGFEVDPRRNASVRPGEVAKIGSEAGRVRILAVPTSEELLIARAVCRQVAPGR